MVFGGGGVKGWRPISGEWVFVWVFNLEGVLSFWGELFSHFGGKGSQRWSYAGGFKLVGMVRTVAGRSFVDCLSFSRD